MGTIVTSPNNPIVKLMKSLHRRKYRDEYGLYFIEGYKMVAEAITQKIPIHSLIYSRDFNIQPLQIDIHRRDIPQTCVDSRIFKQISDVKTPQGVIAILEKKSEDLAMITEEEMGFWVALDRVQDPGNLGTIVRTVDAAGGSGLIMLEDCVDPYNPKSIRATMGSIFRVPIVKVCNSRDFFSHMLNNGADILASTMEGKNIFNWEGNNSKGIKILVIGNESQGIDQEILSLATDIVSIPIAGGAESLNASVAAGIMIYEIMRKVENLGQGNSCIWREDML